MIEAYPGRVIIISRIHVMWGCHRFIILFDHTFCQLTDLNHRLLDFVLFGFDANIYSRLGQLRRLRASIAFHYKMTISVMKPAKKKNQESLLLILTIWQINIIFRMLLLLWLLMITPAWYDCASWCWSGTDMVWFSMISNIWNSH